MLTMKCLLRSRRDPNVSLVSKDNGLTPYTGTINNKPPGIFLLYYYSYRLFGTNIWFTRLVGDIASMGASLCLFAFVRRISGSVCAAAISAGLYISLKRLKGFHVSAGYTETFLVFFVLLSLLLLVLAVEREGQKHHDDICRRLEPARRCRLNRWRYSMFWAL